MIDRRNLIMVGAASAIYAGVPAYARKAKVALNPAFPNGFIWGAATAGHQVEGNNVASDLWFLENLETTAFAEPSGDAVNSFELWPVDVDIVKSLGLTSYRFSLEWARIEPVEGQFSVAMLNHYKAMIDGCRERGLAPLVTFNHFTSPLWFSAKGGWLNPKSPQLFARYCKRAAEYLGAGISHAMTFNEPNILRLLKTIGLPQFILDKQKAMLELAAKKLGTDRFTALNVASPEQLDDMLPNMIAGHRAGKAAIKSVRPDLPVGLTLAMFDDQAVGKNSLRDTKREENYGAWLRVAKEDDFLGVQNYERAMWDAKGHVAAPANAIRNHMGAEVYAPSLAGAVKYAHEATGVPILVTEHGVGTEDDQIRASFIPAALAELKKIMDSGVPVLGYCHWSLLDNYEWIFGYKPKYGLVAVDRTNFKRTPKPSAVVYGKIARQNRL
jgi:beta-glucosidase